MLFSLDVCSPQPAQLYRKPAPWFVHGSYLDMACRMVHYNFKSEDEAVAHSPLFMGCGRREPMVFSSISLLTPSLILDQGYCSIWTFPSYFLNGEPGPVGFVESSTRSLSLGSLVPCGSGDSEGGSGCWYTASVWPVFSFLCRLPYLQCSATVSDFLRLPFPYALAVPCSKIWGQLT